VEVVLAIINVLEEKKRAFSVLKNRASQRVLLSKMDVFVENVQYLRIIILKQVIIA
jgi:hypothetical protein